MTKTTAVREARESDLPAIIGLYTDAGLNPTRKASIEEARRIYTRIRKYPDYAVYVAVEDAAVIGTFALLIMDNLANGGRPSAIVEDVAVSPDRQGQGIGRQMMDFAMDRAKERGCYKLVLSSNEKRAAAHRFYESLGYARHGISFKVEAA